MKLSRENFQIAQRALRPLVFDIDLDLDTDSLFTDYGDTEVIVQQKSKSDKASVHMKLGDALASSGDVTNYVSFAPLPDFPGFAEELNAEKIMEDLGIRSKIWGKVFIGPKGTVTDVHCAGISNLFLQLKGSKRWRLYAPDNPYVHGVYKPKFKYPGFGAWFDTKKENTLHYDIVLEEGQALFIPPFWWHQVRGLSPSVSVALWWMDIKDAFKASPKMSALSFYSMLRLKTANYDMDEDFGEDVHEDYFPKKELK